MIIWTAGTPHCPPLQLLHLCLLSLPLSLCHLGWLIIAFQKQSTPLLPPPPPSTVSTSSTSSSSAPFSTDSITQSAYRTIKGPSLREGQWPRLLRTHTAAYRQLFKQQCLTHTHTHQHQHQPLHGGEGDWLQGHRWRRKPAKQRDDPYSLFSDHFHIHTCSCSPPHVVLFPLHECTSTIRLCLIYGHHRPVKAVIYLVSLLLSHKVPRTRAWLRGTTARLSAISAGSSSRATQKHWVSTRAWSLEPQGHNSLWLIPQFLLATNSTL